ncbi:hypothetical protein EET67_00645 [Pseudaminobacter arsenicus]|uniref:Carboxypeptidase regulatory-like domain-containing protein n=1 Tax=Borborobacter arsenicus TaxID=1851146 RepID=A0A432VBF6_9HYPH|nr:hypothetical protein [Pseudaminobacter arsenicus]RUM99456.1 hypothetical protein EET67_00645 [Pseudaminobacter arsenicus]
MRAGFRRHFISLAVLALMLPAAAASAQEGTDALPDLKLPDISGFAEPKDDTPLAQRGGGELTLAAKLTDDGEDIGRGLMWRVFRPEPGPDGKLPLVASAQGGTSLFHLEPGSYLVHASFGRAGATKRITVTRDPKQESVVLDAGGLKLDAVLEGGLKIPPKKLRFSIYEAQPEADGDRALIIPDVRPNVVVRLNSGVYHIVSTYGSVNAVIRSDIRVEAGKLTEATVEHRAAELTLKLVREEGGEAIADTSWSVLTNSGDPVRESVGAFASMVLAEGDYTIVAKNRDRIYQREFTVVAGRNQEVEVLANEANSTDANEGAD